MLNIVKRFWCWCRGHKGEVLYTYAKYMRKKIYRCNNCSYQRDLEDWQEHK